MPFITPSHPGSEYTPRTGKSLAKAISQGEIKSGRSLKRDFAALSKTGISSVHSQYTNT